MNNYLQAFVHAAGAATVDMIVRFDAQRDTPELFEAASLQLPVLRELMASLRLGIPLVPSSRIGSFGNFVRLPNHYRSVCFLIPGPDGELSGAIAFKGTEPLLPDFPDYLAWMLNAPFRTSSLPLGLHFPLDMKLPPCAMWIDECRHEQEISSRIQGQYLLEHGKLAKLPVPLFVMQLTTAQLERYRDCVRALLPTMAFDRVATKIAAGLGVEVYYYPSLPVRAADLFTMEVKSAYRAVLNAKALERTFNHWIELMADLLALGYMPYAPWHHGMGAYVDPGNACIDGGFNDLLTIVPFDSIPNGQLLWVSLDQSIHLLAHSILTMCAGATGMMPPAQPEQFPAAVAYVNSRLRRYVRSRAHSARVDARLVRVLESPSVEDVCRHLRETQRDPGAAQFRQSQQAASLVPSDAVGHFTGVPLAGSAPGNV